MCGLGRIKTAADVSEYLTVFITKCADVIQTMQMCTLPNPKQMMTSKVSSLLKDLEVSLSEELSPLGLQKTSRAC